MLPSVVATEIRQSVRRFLRATFPMTTNRFRRDDGRSMLDDFLAREDNLLRGPYLDIGLPFRRAEADARALFERFELPFQPYQHQLRAFERLTGPSPRSTLIATGTGSGKTECFSYPILDYCATENAPGIKAIIVYPMNALATDQSQRFAREIWQREELRGRVSVGLYVGDSEQSPAEAMGPEQVITNKETLRANPPDILLTNYKMLDFLLLRPKDQRLWQFNEPGRLRYIVVDELHTFDGAQGTDLACLIRRLRDRFDPDGGLTCVGTSATIGGETAREDLLAYARKVFASDFDDDALVLEDRLRPAEFVGEAPVEYTEWPTRVARIRPEIYQTAEEYLRAVALAWFGRNSAPALSSSEPDVATRARFELGNALRRCAAFRELLAQTEKVTDVNYLLADWQQRFRIDEGIARQLLDSLLALVSAAKTPANGDPADAGATALPFVQVRHQLWLRELTRLVSSVSEEPMLRFHDELTETGGVLHLPTIHCRECHATGWVTVKRPGEGRLESDVQEIYKAYFGRHPDCTLLFPLASESPQGAKGIDGVVCPACEKVVAYGAEGPCPDCEARAQRLRVWLPDMLRAVKRDEAAQQRMHHDCPFCGGREGLSLIGSRAASLASVTIGQLFASPHNDRAKLIAFSDSVQDAAHRAGFFGARTYTTTVRTAIAQFLGHQGEGLSLADAAAEVPRYWQERCGEKEQFVGTFIAPDMEWLQDYEALRKQQQLPKGSNLSDLVASRLTWEVLQGLGLRARIGRTLERTFSAAVGVDLPHLQQVAKELHTHLSEELGQLRDLRQAAVLEYLLGLLWWMRVQGAFYHPFLDSYIKSRGNRFQLMRSLFMPNYGQVSRPPALVSLGHVSDSFHSLQREGGSWHFSWFNKVLAEGDNVLASAEFRQATELTVNALVRGGYLIEKTVGSDSVWGLDPGHWICTADVTGLACGDCGHRIQVPSENADTWAGVACLRTACAGSYARDDHAQPEAAYRFGQVKRLSPAEHTGLLDGETRHAVERSFMQGGQPWDINLLSATPTLEMGIDVGDLSSILLCSVPPTQANYLQRIGRAGRRDGNALTVTVANGHNHDLYFYQEPLAMIAGDVRTPGVFLEATAVLERQLIAYCMDRWAASGIDETAIPGSLRDVLNALQAGEQQGHFPSNLLEYIAAHRNAIFQGFVAMFPDLSAESREHLRTFLFGNEQDSGISYRLTNRLHRLLQERQSYKERIDRLKKRKDQLEALPEDDSTIGELEEVLAERGALMQLRRRINATPTLNFFTDEGLLPNYAFPEEGVTLQSVIIRRRSRQERTEGGDEQRAYDKLNFQMQRPAQSAISELAPMNHFYAVGRRVEIDQVDLKLSEVHTWRLCDRCHYVENIDETGDPHSACPRCGSGQWADAGRRRQMLKLRQVYASADDRASRIADDSDQRTPVFYNRQMLVNVPPSSTRKAYRLQSEQLPFGFEYLAKVELREINFGQPDPQQEPMPVAGESMPRPGFQLCCHCGTVRRQGGRKKPGFQHAFDCKLRKSGAQETEEDYFDSLYLFRELTSEAVRILLPLSEVGTSGRRLYSLIAALNLGLRQYFRGNVDHIQASYYSEPEGVGNQRRHYLVLFDSVPGGTGYLKELLRKPENLIDLISQAHTVLAQCSCAEDPDRDGCYQCILAYREARRMDEISRGTAEDLLRKILNEADALEEVEGLDTIELNSLLESDLEERFVQALRNASPEITYTPESFRGKPGAFITITSHASDSRTTAWRLEFQVHLGPEQGVAVQTKADFVFWPVRAQVDVRPVAIYVDGFQYHYNNLGDDTLKRQAILDSGRFRVWSLGWHDLPVSGQKVTNPTKDLLQKGQGSAMQKLFTGLARLGGWRNYVDYQATIARGSFQWLLDYLSAGETELQDLQHAALSRGIGWLDQRTVQNGDLRRQIFEEVDAWAPEGVREVIHDAENTDSFAFGGVLEALEQNAPPVRILSAVPLSAMSAAREGDVASLQSSPGAMLAIDDTYAEATKEFENEWKQFWGAANLLQFLPRLALVSRTGLATGEYQSLHKTWVLGDLTPEATGEVVQGEMAAWQEVGSWSFLGAEVARRLQEAGLSVPVVGHEVQTQDGEVIGEADLAWVSAKIAIVPPEMAEDATALEGHGWTVFLGLTDAQVLTLQECLEDPSASHAAKASTEE